MRGKRDRKYRYSELKITSATSWVQGVIVCLLRTNVRLPLTTPLGNKIRELRKNKGYTLEDLAQRADSSKSYIWELENKNPPRPSADKVAKVAAALGVTSDYLMDKSQKAPGTAVLDDAFFRDYQNLDETTKKKIRDLVDLWGEKE
jgi:transcriptional regulator with XRE-family HTH domain